MYFLQHTAISDFKITKIAYINFIVYISFFRNRFFNNKYLNFHNSSLITTELKKKFNGLFKQKSTF